MPRKILPTTQVAPVLRDYQGDLKKVWFVDWITDGKRYRRNVSGPTANIRYEKARKIIREINCPPKKQETDCVLGKWSDFLKGRQNLRSSTLRDYGTVYRAFDTWLKSERMDKFPPTAFGKKEATRYMRTFETAAKSNSTYNKHRQCLNQYFAWLEEEEIITRNPFAQTRAKNKCNAPAAAFPEQKMRVLRDLIKERNYSLYLCCMLQLYAFIRPGEVRLLRVKDIDLQGNYITVPKEVAKNKKSKQVYIMPRLAQILSEYFAYADNYSKENYFVGKGGKPSISPVPPNYWRETHQKLIRTQGYDTRTHKLYSWKHTGNSLAKVRGASNAFLCKQNRHSSEGTTEIYLQSVTIEHLVEKQVDFFDF